MELRKSRRYRLSAAAVFWWKDSNGILQERTGTTRDICSAGSFVVADTVPPDGALVEIDIFLPGVEASTKIVQLHGDGRVVRIDRVEMAVRGFAAELAFQTESSGGATSMSSDNS